MVKQRNDSAKIYLEQNRKELAGVELSQANIISEFLPNQLSKSELSEIIDKVIDELGAKSMKDMGKVMGAIKSELQGKADMGLVSQIVKSSLSN